MNPCDDSRSFAIAVDVGGTTVKSALVQTDGRVGRMLRTPTPRSRDSLTECLRHHLSRQLAGCKKANVSPAGVGIACLGAVDPLRGTVVGACDTLPIIEGYPIVEIAGRATHLSVAIENDVNAAAYGDYFFRDSNERDSLLYVALGTGIGGGFVSHGKILHGEESVALELGHQTISYRGRRCPCGRRGCWETYLSQAAILRDYNAQCKIVGRADSVKTVFDKARAGESCARLSVERTLKYLVIGLANLVNLFDPSIVVIGGGVGLGLRPYLGDVRRELISRTFRNDLRVVPPLKPKHGSLLGAASLVFAKSRR